MAVPVRSVPIIVLAGQSNANSVGIGQAVFDEVTAEQGLYIHAAVNGSSLSAALDVGNGDWSASGAAGSGELLTSLMAQISAMLDPNSPTYIPGAYLKKVVWVQGEADTWLTAAATNYAKDLKALHTAMTASFGAHDLVISALCDAAITGTATTDNHRANWATVQRAQLALAAADSTIHLIDPDAVATKGGYSERDMLVSDHLHYNSATGYATALGRALAQAGSSTALAPAALEVVNPGPHYATGSERDDNLFVAATGLGQAYGSAGFDTLSLTDRTVGVKIAAGGMDALRVTANGGSAFYLDLVSIESLVLTNGDDKVVMAAGLSRVASGNGNDWINGLDHADTILLGAGNDLGHGGAGNDSIFGGIGSDLLYGSDGNDLLAGDGGTDRLYGGAGTDRLSGDGGNDSLWGGADSDVFVFASGTSAGKDQIFDFENGLDRIELHGSARNLVITDAGSDTRVSWADLTIILHGVDHNQITAADFNFT